MATLCNLLGSKLQLLLLIIRFRVRLIRYAITALPIAGADGASEDEDSPPEGEGESGESDDEEGDDPDKDAVDEEKPSAEPDWKRMARKHEREAKKARKEREDFEQRLKAREDADKSEQEKAIEDAEQRARDDLESKFETERRKDRLELATTKIASKGLRIGSGDDAKTVRFADSDDALLHLEREIRNGDLDADDIFGKDGKVRTDQLTEALTDLLERKPHLAASDAGKPEKVKGSADARKGEPASTEPTVEEQFKAIRRPRPQADQNVLVTRQQ